MKKFLIAVLAVCLTASIAIAADTSVLVESEARDKSNLPASHETDKFTTYQQTDDDDQVKALIGADRIPVVDNARIDNPQFVGERQGGSVSNPTTNSPGIRQPNAPANPSGPSAPVQP